MLTRSKKWCRPAIARDRYSHIRGFRGRLSYSAGLGFSFLGFIRIGIVVVLGAWRIFLPRDAMQSVNVMTYFWFLPQ